MVAVSQFVGGAVFVFEELFIAPFYKTKTSVQLCVLTLIAFGLATLTAVLSQSWWGV